MKPLWWKDDATHAEEMVGLVTTRVVMARSEAEARRMACELVKKEILDWGGDPRNASAVADVQESAAIHDIVWRAPKGYSFFLLE